MKLLLFSVEKYIQLRVRVDTSRRGGSSELPVSSHLHFPRTACLVLLFSFLSSNAKMLKVAPREIQGSESWLTPDTLVPCLFFVCFPC